MNEFLNRFFCLAQRKTTIRREFLGGLTTFLTMAYIIVVNPGILAGAGIPIGPSTVATISVAVFGTLFMGLYANRPIAVAPYMGENAFIASLAGVTIAGQLLGWQQLLGAVFVSGAAFLILTLVGLRQWLSKAISPSLKHSFAVGIGLFLLFLGLMSTRIVVRPNTPPSVPVPLSIGPIHTLPVFLAIVGFVVMTILMYWRITGAILIGMVLTAAVGIACGLGEVPDRVLDLPYDVMPIALQLDIQSAVQIAFFPILLTLLLMSFLDTLGTLMAVGAAGDMLDESGDFPDVQKPMIVDSTSCMFAGLIGTTTSGAYIESATGIREGAQTGLASVFTAGFFVIALFFLPLFKPLQSLSFAYGPALIVVGILMLRSVREIDFDDLTECVPAIATIAMMVFTYNIANGLTAGLVVYPVMKSATGKWQDVKPAGWVLGGLCLSYYVFGHVH